MKKFLHQNSYNFFTEARLVYNGGKPAAVEAEKIRIDTQKERNDVDKLNDKDMKNEPGEGNDPVKGYLDGVQKAIDASIAKNFGKDAQGAINRYTQLAAVRPQDIALAVNDALNGITSSEDWSVQRNSIVLPPALNDFPSAKSVILDADNLDAAKAAVGNIETQIEKEVSKAEEEADAAQKSINNGKNVKAELSALAINTVKEKHRAAFDAFKDDYINKFAEGDKFKNLDENQKQQLKAYVTGVCQDAEISYPKEDWEKNMSDFIQRWNEHFDSYVDAVKGNKNTPATVDENMPEARKSALNLLNNNPQINAYVQGLTNSANDVFTNADGKRNDLLKNNYLEYLRGMLASLPPNSDFAKVRAAGLLSPTEYAKNAGYKVENGKVTDEEPNKTNDWNSAKEANALKSERSVVDGVQDSGVDDGMEKFANNMKDARVKAFFDQQMAEAARMWGGMPDAPNRIGWYRRKLVTEICKLDNPANVTGKCTTFRNYMRSADARLKAAPATGGGGGGGGSADTAKSAPVASESAAKPGEATPKPAESAAKTSESPMKPAESVAPTEKKEESPGQQAKDKVVGIMRKAVSDVKGRNLTDAVSIVNNLNIALAASQSAVSAAEKNLLTSTISGSSNKLLKGHKFVITYNPSNGSFRAFEQDKTT